MRALTLACAGLVVVVLVSLVVPNGYDIPAGAVVALALHWMPFPHMPHAWSQDDAFVILQVRLPRTLTAVVAGAALAAAGATFQGLFRNPLADPAVIGVSSGAALGAVVAMLFPLDLAYAGFSLVSVAAFGGAMAAVAAVYALARVGGRVPVTTLLLGGFAVSAVVNAAATLIMSLAGTRLQGMFAWLLGGIDTSTWDQLIVASVLTIVGLLPLFMLGGTLNALTLGDEQAMHVGLDPARSRLALVVCAALVASVAVALCGIIGFVGLVVPHMTRLLFGPDNRLLLPVATVLGAAYLTGVDAAARLLIPVTLPIGVVTALIGAPLFLLLLRRRQDYVFQ